MDLLAERLAFCEQHPFGSITPSDVSFLLTSLVEGPEEVLELADGQGRALLAVLIQSCTNMADAAEFTPLGYRPSLASEELAETALAWALEKARHGPRTQLELPGPEQGFLSEALLRRRGFTEAYRLHEMERSPAPPPELPPLAPGLRVEDLEPGWVASLHEAVSRAFASVPGAFVAPLPEYSERVLSCPIRPRVVLAGERVVGFVRVELGGEHVGRIQSLGRHPEVAGTGVGPRLLAEGLHLLAERGAGPVRLEVAVENERALELYRRAGFTPVRSTSTWRLRLAKARGLEDPT